MGSVKSRYSRVEVRDEGEGCGHAMLFSLWQLGGMDLTSVS